MLEIVDTQNRIIHVCDAVSDDIIGAIVIRDLNKFHRELIGLLSQ